MMKKMEKHKLYLDKCQKSRLDSEDLKHVKYLSILFTNKKTLTIYLCCFLPNQSP